MDDGRLVVGNVWKERAYSGGEWKQLLGTARNLHILYMILE
jgi:hypothetical protein